MRFIRTTNNIAEFIETSDKTGKIISSMGFQFGEVYYQIKNGKVTFYLNDQENPFRNDIWSLNIPFVMDGVEYADEDSASAHLYAVFNDRFQEQLDQLKEDLADEITRSTAKDAEHDTQISGLTNTLNSEIQRALSAETQLHNEIINEQNRALAAESGITANLNSEISRSTEKDAQHDAQISALTVSLDNEINRATTAENSLRSDLNDEIADRISGDTNLQNQLNAEIARAQNAEEDIYDKIDAEIARANSEETRIEGKLDNEITRSTAKDASHDTLISGLTTSLQNEINRATTAENSLRNDLNAEISRATNAENTLDDKIDVEIQNRINAISGLTERVADDEASTGAALVDLNDKANALSGENASQNVQISGLNNSINTEISRATSVENALRSDLTNETSARTNADAAILERIVAVEVGKADANSVYTKTESDNKYATKDYISGLTDEFQEKLVAGENITIVGNVISATGGGGGVTPSEVQEMIDESISGKADSDDVYTKNEVYTKAEVDEAIDDIDLSNYYTKSEVDASQLAQDNKINAISGDVQTLNEKVETISGESVTSGEVESMINEAVSGKQDTLSAGTNIQINNNVISATDTKYTAGRGIAIANNTVAFDLPIYLGGKPSSISITQSTGNTQYDNKSNGFSSAAIGAGLKALNQYEVAVGVHNVERPEVEGIAFGGSGYTLFTVGNGCGSSSTQRHNALEIRQNGDIYISDTNASGDFCEKPMIKLQDALGQGGGGVTSGQVQTMIDNSLVGYQEELSAGTNVQISNNVISATDTKYTAGDGITISNNVISAKIWSGTQAQYDAITTKDSSTIYLIYS